MESSDESFLWTDASNDCHSDSKMSRDENGDIESESGHSYKKKLQKKLFDNNESVAEEGNVKKKSKKRKHSNIGSPDFNEPRRKHIKSEPESDIDKQCKTNKSQILHSDNAHTNEDFLNYKVKEEQISNETITPKVKKKKKKHRESNADSHSDEPEPNVNGIHPQNDQIAELNKRYNDSYFKEEQETENRPKKKKAKKKVSKEFNKNSLMEEENVFEQTVQDDNTMDTTILDKLCKLEEKTQISFNKNILLENSQSLVDNGDDGEISKINSSYLNTSAEKQIKHALSQNGDDNDMMLSCGGKIPKRSLKISDRITFEEEETFEFDNGSQTYKKNNTKYSTHLQKYFKTNNSLIDISPSIKSDCAIFDDEEIWVLQCPSDIDVENLKDSTVVIDTKCKLKVESQTYIGFSESNTTTMTILTIGGNKPVIKTVPLSGLIHLHKRVPKPHFIEDNNVINNQTNFIPLPDTKCRHPLFGVNYKNAIKVPKHVAERLHGIDSESVPVYMNDKIKKVKKKRKMKPNLSDIEDDAKAEPEIRPKKLKRKRSRDRETPPKRPKRPKRPSHDPECATWDSERAIEQQLFNF